MRPALSWWSSGSRWRWAILPDGDQASCLHVERGLLIDLEVVGSGSYSSLESFHPIFDVLSTGEENGQGLGCPEADHIEVAGHDAGWSHTCRGHE